ncbi:alpha/beta hydrolase [Marinomonas primoryensis]|uniref:Alpha/beta hydrolase fold-3 domain-containing protein n=1 Tax=Marinomonas primoryensis TaxID=178399 RepID=A0A859D075_9GAMM|nr:alpha/beta hydrolase [Marinomonas primoryensis]QKK81852.1 uncharacterized protein MP3633_3125 [Marinomonas primoryensis]
MEQLDAQVSNFIELTMSYYTTRSMANIHLTRQCYRDMSLALSTPVPDSIVIKNDRIIGQDDNSIPIRHYLPKHLSIHENLQVVYFHGGGFIVGDLDTHDDVCAGIADTCGINLVSVDYRLAPEHQYPCDIKDCLSLVDGLLAQGKFIILVGDSAGANLAACVANARSNYTETQLLGQILIYPVLAHNELTQSMNEHANAPLLTKEHMTFYHASRVGGDTLNIPEKDPLYCPLQASSFNALPESYLFPAQIDPLYDDCKLYAQALKNAGVKVENYSEIGIGLVHGYLRARHISDKAAFNFKKICETVSTIGREHAIKSSCAP